MVHGGLELVASSICGMQLSCTLPGDTFAAFQTKLPRVKLFLKGYLMMR